MSEFPPAQRLDLAALGLGEAAPSGAAPDAVAGVPPERVPDAPSGAAPAQAATPIPSPIPVPLHLALPLPGPPEPSPRDRLARTPGRFDLDQGIAVAAHGVDARDLHYRTSARLAHAEGAIVQADPAARTLTLATFGLIGPGGVLPRHHTATVATELRKRSAALHAFLDMLGGRFAGLWAKAGAKYRPTRDPQPAERALSAALGLGTPHLTERAGAPEPALLFHAGNLSARTRSAERLRAMLEEEAGGAVELVEFAGGWLRLPEEERTRLGGRGRRGGVPGQHSALGQGAVLGGQVWDAQSRFIVRIGPLPREAFEALLPGTPGHARLLALCRLHVGLDTGFALNPVLAREDVPALRLGAAAAGARLGWSSWLTRPTPRRRDGTEPIFDAR
ncbi:type VI secretion system baseplate subunit TssG [Roseomonas sp. BN140053]|uniref:type VI secretion system baseplate subunit TssG n=1 Tax=Roseomonas sp. BN140053 TaxID=3391898 RepID=UPI0039EBC218